ncbi:hypothetical protein CCR83_12515 [Rhodobacter veldkampii DSM 11550]|uniref:Uncharacterized protein n=1 Tax=Phaeovulum veldkampii DSM 11550 TaxID=1185920 RepID=A0A2T4JJ05_9RHOB|nr:hypothetical protein [Phaeovulum veldkampii]MBK5947241.1 hypothetical protein [Phaeovulum veldkampii DSM 11550]PTE17901.1 hypothetical protein C5F46_06660 [Phaeovulum veldkampii DSM 11550]TDQ56753.1 hypothetical protein EV658_11673 [Phaeovulum veldkampii DSM 11550]
MIRVLLRRHAAIPALALALALPLAAAAQTAPDPLPGRDAHDSHALTRWIGLPHERQLLVLQSLGVAVPQDYFNCVCRAAGYGSPGTAQFYHPDTLGDYDKRYSCQHPGPPCIVSGFGCLRHDLPTDPAIFERCAALAGLEGGNPMDNILEALADRANRTALPGNPVVMNADPLGRPQADCAKARAEAGLAPPAADAVPPEREIYTISPETMKLLYDVALEPELKQRLINVIREAMAAGHQIIPGDEADLRFDIDAGDYGFEAAVSIDAQKRLHISEIIVKKQINKKYADTWGKLNAEGGLKLSYSDPDEGTFLPGSKVTGGKVGLSWEYGRIEAKYGIDINTSSKATDYYDGEWRNASENRLVRGLEDVLSNLDFYGGGAVNVKEVALPGEGIKISVGVESGWKLKDRYSNWVFSDMHEALDDLLDNQKQWEEQRHAYIDREAQRFGIDARCFATGEAISLVHAAYEKAKAADPSIVAPFQTITEKIAERRRIATEPPAPPTVRRTPTPAPAPVHEGIWPRVFER